MLYRGSEAYWRPSWPCSRMCRFSAGAEGRESPNAALRKERAIAVRTC